MIEKIKHYLYLFYNVKLEFSNPPQKKIMVFDSTSIDDFKYVLSKKKYYILESRHNKIKKIYISLDIISLFLKYFNFNLFSSYLIAVIKVIKPKIVLTTIDNSYKFHEIAKILSPEKINFIAVQNAARYDLEENNLLFKINKKKNGFFIPLNNILFKKNHLKTTKYFKIVTNNLESFS